MTNDSIKLVFCIHEGNDNTYSIIKSGNRKENNRATAYFVSSV